MAVDITRVQIKIIKVFRNFIKKTKGSKSPSRRKMFGLRDVFLCFCNIFLYIYDILNSNLRAILINKIQSYKMVTKMKNLNILG